MNEHDRFRFFVRPRARASAFPAAPAARAEAAALAARVASGSSDARIVASTASRPAASATSAALATRSGADATSATLAVHADGAAGAEASPASQRAFAGPSRTTVSRATWPAASPARKARRRHLRLVTKPGQQRDDGGFSLLELLVVVAILGILVAAALPRFAEFRAAAYDSRSQQDLRNLAAAEELFRATSPTYADDTALLTGFQPSEGVEVTLESADETGFVATASHPAGARDFRWDSSADPPLSSVAR